MVKIRRFMTAACLLLFACGQTVFAAWTDQAVTRPPAAQTEQQRFYGRVEQTKAEGGTLYLLVEVQQPSIGRSWADEQQPGHILWTHELAAMQKDGQRVQRVVLVDKATERPQEDKLNQEDYILVTADNVQENRYHAAQLQKLDSAITRMQVSGDVTEILPAAAGWDGGFRLRPYYDPAVDENPVPVPPEIDFYYNWPAPERASGEVTEMWMTKGAEAIAPGGRLLVTWNGKVSEDTPPRAFAEMIGELDSPVTQ